MRLAFTSLRVSDPMLPATFASIHFTHPLLYITSGSPQPMLSIPMLCNAQCFFFLFLHSVHIRRYRHNPGTPNQLFLALFALSLWYSKYPHPLSSSLEVSGSGFHPFVFRQRYRRDIGTTSIIHTSTFISIYKSRSRFRSRSRKL